MALKPEKVQSPAALCVCEVIATSPTTSILGRFALLETYVSCNGPRMRVVAVYPDKDQAMYYMSHPEAFTLEGFS